MNTSTPPISTPGIPRNANQFAVTQAKEQGTFKTDEAMQKLIKQAIKAKDKDTSRLAKTITNADVVKVTAQKHTGGVGMGDGTRVDPSPHYTVKARGKSPTSGREFRLTVHVKTKPIGKGNSDVVTKITI